MSANHRVLRLSRTIHLYLGVFMAPALLFFAITGGLQTFSLHETTRGSSYTPPAWLATMALLHKKQTTLAPVRKPRVPESGAAMMGQRVSAISATATPGGASSGDSPLSSPPLRVPPVPVDATQPKKNLLPMKLFFVLVAISLCLSTMTGLYMAYRYSRKPKLVSSMLLAGVLVPLLLLLL